MSASLKVVHAVEIYDGRDRIGEVQELGNGQFRAIDTRGNTIGAFDKQHAAQSAVIAVRHGRAA